MVRAGSTEAPFSSPRLPGWTFLQHHHPLPLACNFSDSLVPHRVFTNPSTQQPLLPQDGQTGDLLAVVLPDGNQAFQAATLWFCERGIALTGPVTGAATWRKVALTDSVTGTG